MASEWATLIWGNCSVAKLTEIEFLHIKVRRLIHKVSQNVLDSKVLDYIKWQDPGYIYKRRLAIEVFKVKQGLNSRLIPFLLLLNLSVRVYYLSKREEHSEK